MEGTPKQSDKLNILIILVVGLVGTFGLYASFVALQAFYEVEDREVQERRFAEEQSDEFRGLQATQQGELQDYRWLSQADRTLTLPIGRAMDVVIAEVNKGNASNLVPSVGPHDTPTVPAVFGRPPDNVKMPEQKPAPGEPAPAGSAPGATEGAAGATEGAAGATEGAAGAGGAASEPPANPPGNAP